MHGLETIKRLNEEADARQSRPQGLTKAQARAILESPATRYRVREFVTIKADPVDLINDLELAAEILKATLAGRA